MYKFQLGSKVTSKKTGLPMTGYVVGICMPIMFGLMRGVCTQVELFDEYPRWTDLYPDWVNKPVYTVSFNSPMRTVNLEEYHKYGGSDGGYENLPKAIMAGYPEDDLELLEEGVYVPAR
jgi:hypothetical protein